MPPLKDVSHRPSRQPDEIRRQRLWSWHRMTIPAWNAMLKEQGDACAICESPEPNGKNWHVDHDHNCCPGKKSCGKCIRGLLCGRCNVMLGMAKDDPTTLIAAVEYLANSEDFNALQSSLAAPG